LGLSQSQAHVSFIVRHLILLTLPDFTRLLAILQLFLPHPVSFRLRCEDTLPEVYPIDDLSLHRKSICNKLVPAEESSWTAWSVSSAEENIP
jgi:hypothetical protein